MHNTALSLNQAHAFIFVFVIMYMREGANGSAFVSAYV